MTPKWVSTKDLNEYDATVRGECPRCGDTGSVRVHGHEDYGVSFECESCDCLKGWLRDLHETGICPRCGGKDFDIETDDCVCCGFPSYEPERKEYPA